MEKYSLPDKSYSPDFVVLANGEYPAAEPALSILAGASRVVCCDGAAKEYVSRGGTPYAIVGDCDSLPTDMRERYAAILHTDSDQETNDLTKAVMFCIAEGAKDIAILGATGRREDHTLGNIGLLADYATLASVKLITDWGVFDPITESSRFESFPRQQVSIFCPDPAVKVTTVDLKYPLHEANLTAWWQGTLNEATGGSFGFDIEGGTAIVFRTFLPK